MALGALFRRLARPIRDINVLNRAQRFVDKSKNAAVANTPTKSDQKVEDTSNRLSDSIIDKIGELGDSIKTKSTDLNQPIWRDERARLEVLYGDPGVIPEGSITIRELLEMSVKSKMRVPGSGNECFSVSYLAAEYSLDEQLVARLLDFYQPCLIVPDPAIDPAATKKSLGESGE